MAIVQNVAKRKLREGDIALGFGLHHLRTSAAPMLAAAGRHDYVSMDMEHGAFTVQEATQICIACLAAGIPAFVRVCAGALDEATRLLDNGALGIIVPHVDTKQQAHRIADAFHYPPMGHRSWGGPPPLYGYMPPHVSEAQQAINDEVLTVVMIESPEGVKNADEIASVDGIDVLLIGSFDLTSELGIPGQMGHQKLIDAYQVVGDACRKHGKALGMGGINDDENARRYIAMGSRYLASGTDHSFIVSGSIQRSKFYRDVAAEVAGAAGKHGMQKRSGSAAE
jgi:2-keto-3-deoxy-L-rhamnonate aldolase RhmA